LLLNALSRAAWHTLARNRRLLEQQQRSLLSGSDGKRILEIGSGQRRGSNLFQSAVEFAPAGAEFQMTDVNPSLGHPILDIRVPDQALGRFDLVLCCNVLEHIDDLGAAVSGLASVCEDEGMVFASTPFVYPYHDEPGDFWRPTAYGLKFIFEREFADVTVTWTGLRRFPFQLFVHARGPRR
jgi:SAM-dependent methyltransferase